MLGVVADKKKDHKRTLSLLLLLGLIGNVQEPIYGSENFIQPRQALSHGLWCCKDWFLCLQTQCLVLVSFQRSLLWLRSGFTALRPSFSKQRWKPHIRCLKAASSC